ncbi:PadR family transcriptional regulator [Corynebacterium cystitidis]|uniref:PadR family transcriptional regulator n=1 Tax=Corynebacterium cystitidis TaxID=35757 RepID=UPI00211DCACA|nr:PadR family transcriptional regulator [Corynebacterium cystitidis]
MLSETPRTPAELQPAFHQATNNLWKLNMGQVSQTLSRLERDGLIHEQGTITTPTGHEATRYTRTDAGSEELAAWWTDPVLRPANDRDELVIKISLARHTPHIDLLRILDSQRRAVLAEIRELNTTLREMNSSLSTQRLAAERRIFDLESDARFLDRVEAMLNEDRAERT